ncbi:MAG TPA: phytanoyl-CoA dioxygenase family protein [Planktothrix sp.]|jgi:hypothetical protein
MSNKIFHDAQLNAEFQKHGFVMVPLLNRSELDEISSQLSTMSPDDQFNPGDGRYHCTFIDTNSEYKDRCDRLFRELVAPKLHDILFEYELLTGNFYVKQPGGSGEFQVHQNWDTVDESKYTSVTAWIPLQDTDEENGTIEFVAGSHKLFPDIATLNAQYYFSNFSDRVKSEYCCPLPMKAGHAVIFDDDIIHYSKANRSTAPRISMQLEFAPTSAELLFYFLDPSAPEKGFDVFESEPNYFLKHSLLDCRNRPDDLKYLRTVPNLNRQVTEREFSRRLKNGEQIRQAFYSGKVYQEPVLHKILCKLGL